jgi:hypothetical protein
VAAFVFYVVASLQPAEQPRQAFIIVLLMQGGSARKSASPRELTRSPCRFASNRYKRKLDFHHRAPDAGGSARKSAKPLWKISRSRSLRIQHLTCERQEPKG